MAGGAAPSADAAGRLPDLNAETHPFSVVQRQIDRAAYFSLHATSEAGVRGAGTAMAMDAVLRTFHIGMRPASGGLVRAVNGAGPAVARYRGRWSFIPDAYRALPGRRLPATPFDPARLQRFAVDGAVRFDGGGDGFLGFGSGATFPPADESGAVAAAAVSDLLEGWGRFRGLQATATWCGVLHPERGFRGHLLLRAMDPEGRWSEDPSDRGEAAIPVEDAEPGVTYLMARGQKRGPHDRTELDLGPGGVEGFHLGQELRALDLFLLRAGPGLAVSARVGGTLGSMTSRVFLDLLDPGAPGTARSPIPFHSVNRYRWRGADGTEVGSVEASGGEGRSFQARLAALPGQQLLRFGAFQPLSGGTGCFAGSRGWLTDNSVVGVAPHVTSTLYVLRLLDPQRRFRAPG